MAFKKKTWADRMVEYAGRRKLTNISTKQSIICDVERSEGTISKEGDAFSSQNMNDLEQRIEDGFTEVKQTTDGINQNLGGYKFDIIDGIPSYKAGADAAWVPFSNPEVYFAQYSFPGDQSTIPFTLSKAQLWLLTNGNWFTQYQNQLKLQINGATVPVASYTKYNNCYIAKFDTKQYINSAASLVVNRSMVVTNTYTYIMLIGV